MPLINLRHPEERPEGVRLEGRMAAKQASSGRGWQFIDLAELGSNTGRSYGVAAARIILYPLAAAVVLGLAIGATTAIGGPAAEAIGPVLAILLQYGVIAL